MSIRLLEYPDVLVTPDHDNSEVKVRFRIPNSSFGPVEIILTFAEAESLAADIAEVIR